jgi:ribosomal-protein-serine acetyltransferase
MFHKSLRPGLELRQLEERDASAALKAIDRDRADLRRWLVWVDRNTSLDDTLTFIRAELEKHAATGEIAAGIWVEQQLAGTIGTHLIDRLNRKVEIGYWLGTPFRGRGVMTGACRAVVEYCFRVLDLNRVEIRCAAGNQASRAIPVRLGFTHEATLREAQLLYGTYHDLEIWSMLRKDFRD